MLKDDCDLRIRRLREAKLAAERERDDCLQQLNEVRVESLAGSIKLKNVRYRLRLARIALHAKRDTVRKRAYFLATRTIRLKKRNGELVARIKQLTEDYDRAQNAIDQFKMAQGMHRCPQCKQKRPFDNFPPEPRFVIGRDLRRCRSCTSRRVKKIHAMKLHRQQQGDDD